MKLVKVLVATLGLLSSTSVQGATLKECVETPGKYISLEQTEQISLANKLKTTPDKLNVAINMATAQSND